MGVTIKKKIINIIIGEISLPINTPRPIQSLENGISKLENFIVIKKSTTDKIEYK